MSNKDKKNKSEINMEELEQASGGKVSTSGSWFWKKSTVTDDRDGAVVATFKGNDANKKAADLDKRLNYDKRG